MRPRRTGRTGSPKHSIDDALRVPCPGANTQKNPSIVQHCQLNNPYFADLGREVQHRNGLRRMQRARSIYRDHRRSDDDGATGRAEFHLGRTGRANFPKSDKLLVTISPETGPLRAGEKRGRSSLVSSPDGGHESSAGPVSPAFVLERRRRRRAFCLRIFSRLSSSGLVRDSSAASRSSHMRRRA